MRLPELGWSFPCFFKFLKALGKKEIAAVRSKAQVQTNVICVTKIDPFQISERAFTVSDCICPSLQQESCQSTQNCH